MHCALAFTLLVVLQIQGKIDHLNQCLEQLLSSWEQRKLIYDQSLDLLVRWLRNIPNSAVFL